MEIVDVLQKSWGDAARIYFDLRRQGLTVRNRIDCGIAQIALDTGFTLIPNDRDFETIGSIRPLRQRRIDLGELAK